MSSWRRLLALAAPYRHRLWLAALLTVASSLVTLAIPWFAGQLLGFAVGSTPGQLHGPAAILILALAAAALLGFAQTVVGGGTAVRIISGIRQQVHDHLQSLEVGFHDCHRQGDLLALQTVEIDRLGYFLTGTLARIPSHLLTAAGAIVIMARIDLRLAALVPLLVPAFYLTLKIVGRHLRSLAVRLQQAEARVIAVAEEHLDMLRATKAFTREPQQSAAYGAEVETARRLALSQTRISAALDPAIGLLAAVAAVLLLLLAGARVQHGTMTPVQLFGFLFYAALLTRPVGALAQLYGQVQAARGALTRLQAILDEPVEPGFGKGMSPQTVCGAIEFRQVRFAYPGRKLLFDGLDLSIREGEVVALTGHNGAGKSTLLHLLLRFYEPGAGQILLDGRNIADLDVRALRQQIGLVSQHVLLFNGAVGDNIGFGRPGASQSEIEAAARLAQAHDFIAALPQGYDTQIGDHGLGLSGGQRQRIALARALLKDPPILALDEATAMYDMEGESAFIEACGTALAGRTVILITHRPASLAMADRVLFLDQGWVVEADPAGRRA